MNSGMYGEGIRPVGVYGKAMPDSGFVFKIIFLLCNDFPISKVVNATLEKFSPWG